MVSVIKMFRRASLKQDVNPELAAFSKSKSSSLRKPSDNVLQSPNDADESTALVEKSDTLKAENIVSEQQKSMYRYILR